ncbi:hypothetical protein [Parasphingorhabdus sp.]|uniref:hypothetical protein n=1 Tax=Parasphingorhabdus sp. TaxID=2709688 RepID=UPI003A8D4268
MSRYQNAEGLREALRKALTYLKPTSPEQDAAQALDDVADKLEAEYRPELARKVRKWKRSVERENPAARHTRRRLARGCIKL